MAHPGRPSPLRPPLLIPHPVDRIRPATAAWPCRGTDPTAIGPYKEAAPFPYPNPNAPPTSLASLPPIAPHFLSALGRNRAAAGTSSSPAWLPASRSYTALA